LAGAISRSCGARLRVPRAIESPTFALWGRGGVEDAIRSDDVLGFDPQDMLSP